jgi:import inner membrane translocase subunit TIM23
MPSVVGFLGAEGALLSMPVFDPTQTVLGLDPLLAVGMATLGGAVASYFAGQSLASVAWRSSRPQLAAEFERMRADFCRRIAHHRANVPPSPTDLNFSLDFYGERIRTIRDYRHWLRKQNQLRNNRIFK